MDSDTSAVYCIIDMLSYPYSIVVCKRNRVGSHKSDEQAAGKALDKSHG